MNKPLFYYPISINTNGDLSLRNAPFIPSLPLELVDPVVILPQDVGTQPQGVYVTDGENWRFALPYPDLCAACISSDQLTVFADPEVGATAPAGSVVYKNGVQQNGLTIAAENAVYVVLTPQTGGYTLPPATASALGGVVVPSSSSLVVDSAGNVDLKPALISKLNNSLSSLTSTGSGTSLVFSVSSSDVVLKSLAVTGPLTLTDASGTLSLGILPATGTTLGAVKAGSGLSVSVDGTLTAVANATTLTGDVTGTGVGVVPTVLANSGVSAGTYNTVTVDAKGRVTVGANTAYLTANQTVAISGDATGSGSTAITLTLSNSGVSAGTYGSATQASVFTVDAKGRLIAADSVPLALPFSAITDKPTTVSGFGITDALTANQNITVSGDASGSGSTAITLTLANSGVAAGTYKSVTVDAKGRVTNGTNPTTLAGFGISDGVRKTGDSVTGDLIFSGGATVTGLPIPSGNGDAANKVYVDNAVAAVAAGVYWKANADVASTGNLTLSGVQTIDSFPTSAGNRVLVKNQTDQKENGVYVVASGAWSRASDIDSGSEIRGMAILVISGLINGLTQWVNTNAVDPSIGADPITYALLSAPTTTYVAGAGLTLTGNQFSISDTGASAGTYTKVTINAQGQVTSGTSLNASDVTTALGYTPYNGATNPSGFLTTNQGITLSGDATGSGSTAITVALANSGVTAGTYTKVTVDTKGRVTVGADLASSDVTTALGYTPYNGTVNPQGFLTSNQTITVSGDASGSGSTAVALTLANSGVTAGTYTKVTVDAKGRVTTGTSLNASDVNTALGYTPYNGTTNPNGFLTSNQSITVSGDASGSGTTSVVLTLADSGVTAGTYTKLTVDLKGRVTSGTNPTTLAGFGITDALPLAGGTMMGDITMTGGATVTGLPTPSASSDAAPKSYVDTAVAGTGSGLLSKSVAGGTDVTLTGTEAANLFYEFTGNLTANINVIVPASARQFFVRNATTGVFTLTVKTASGTGITVLRGTRVHLECDGVNVLFPTSLASRLVVDANGSIGLGTTTPAALFEVATPDSGSIRTPLAKFTQTNQKALTIYGEWGSADLGTSNGILLDPAGGAFGIGSSGSPAVFMIDTSGNVGIGTVAPSQTLDVRSVNGGNITTGRTSNAGVASEPGNYYVTAPNASGSSRVWMSLRTIVTTATNGSEAAVLAFNNQVAGTLREGMRINELGNVLIGKTVATLGARLEVSGDFSAGRTNMPVYIKDNAGTSFGNDIFIPFDGGSSTQKAFRIRSAYNGGSTASKLSIAHATNTGAQNGDPSALTYVEDVIINVAGQVMMGSSGTINGARLTVIGPVSNSGAVACLRNSDTTGAGAWVAQDDTATKYCEMGVLNSATTLTADYGTAGEGYLRSSLFAAGLHNVCANPAGYIRWSIVGSEKMRLNSSGNFGQGVVPSTSWWTLVRAYEIGRAGNAVFGTTNDDEINIGANVINTASNAYAYAASDTASLYRQVAGQHVWLRASAGTAGDVMTLTETMRNDINGNLLVGVASGSTHILSKGSVEATQVLSIANSVGAYVVADFTYNSGNAAVKIGKNTSTSRSVNAAGTVNAGGTDYAEYMTKTDSCGKIAPGQIVGITASGKITDRWAESVSFLIKSTDPSYVGGDTWGTEEALGMTQPLIPVFEAPTYEGPNAPKEDASDLEWAEYTAARAKYEAEVQAAQEHFDTVTIPAYEHATSEFNAALEAARQKVDRIAYCGQVPVNVYRALPGQYVVPYLTANGGIGGVLVDDRAITFEQYRRAVGVVQNLLPDGRANVRVKVV